MGRAKHKETGLDRAENDGTVDLPTAHIHCFWSYSIKPKEKHIGRIKSN